MIKKVQKLSEKTGNVKEACDKLGVRPSQYYIHIKKAQYEDQNGGKLAAFGKAYGRSKVKVIVHQEKADASGGTPRPPTLRRGTVCLVVGTHEEVASFYRTLNR